MPVLFKEISSDLGLDLVQIGMVWGSGSLAAMFIVLIGGLLSDRFGVRNNMIVTCILSGLFGALRGLSNDLASLAITFFAFCLATTVISTNMHKTASLWFSGRQLGLAQGVVSAGMGVGLTLGAMISATLIAPLVGGWRHVFFLYGSVSIIVGLIWLIVKWHPPQSANVVPADPMPLNRALSSVIRIKKVWLLGLIMFGYMACTIGISGYLPLFLRNSGWSASNADGALALYTIAGAAGAIPLSFLSDRLGTRKGIFIPVLMITIICTGLLSVVGGAIVWILVLLIGIARDGFMGLLMAMNFEIKEVERRNSGTALGLMSTISRPGSIISPPLGNSLAGINAGLPFTCWAGFAAISLFVILFMGKSKTKQDY